MWAQEGRRKVQGWSLSLIGQKGRKRIDHS